MVRGLYPKVEHRKKLEHSSLHNPGTKLLYRLLFKVRVYNLLLDICTGIEHLQSKWGCSIFRIRQLLLTLAKNKVLGILKDVWKRVFQFRVRTSNRPNLTPMCSTVLPRPRIFLAEIPGRDLLSKTTLTTMQKFRRGP